MSLYNKMDLLLQQYYEESQNKKILDEDPERNVENYVELKEISSSDSLYTIYLGTMGETYVLFYKKDMNLIADKCSSIYRCEYNKSPRHMYFYYIARKMILYNVKEQPPILLIMVDGQIPSIMQQLTKNEALCFAIYFYVQREKYGLINDIKYILDHKEDAPFLLYFYDYLETLKWSVYDFSIIQKIESIVTTMQILGKLEKTYRNGRSFPLHTFTELSTYYFTKEREKIKNLSKVLSVTLMRSEVYNKNIYILGERHDNNYPCNDVPFIDNWHTTIKGDNGDPDYSIFSEKGAKKLSANHYVADLFEDIKSAKGFFKDLLFEWWYFKEYNFKTPTLYHKYSYDSNLPYFDSDGCLEKDFNNRYDKKTHIGQYQCESYRIEPVDIRRTYDIFSKSDHRLSPFFELINIIVNMKLKFNINIIESRNILDIKLKGVGKEYFDKLKIHKSSIRTIIINLLQKQHIKDTYQLFLNEMIPILTQEISKSYLKREILIYFENKTYNLFRSFYDTIIIRFSDSMWVDSLEENFDKWVEEENSIIFKLMIYYLFGFFLFVISEFMDAYVYSKIFKKMEHHPERPHGSDEYRNILYICGDHHAKNMVDFLQNHHFNVIHSSEATDTLVHEEKVKIRSCVSIEDFEQPFFKLKGFY